MASANMSDFVLRNADKHLTDVKLFASQDDIRAGIHMGSAPNDLVTVEVVASERASPEEHIEVRLVDLSPVRWDGTTAADKDAAKGIVTNANNIVLVKDKHVTMRKSQQEVVPDVMSHGFIGNSIVDTNSSIGNSIMDMDAKMVQLAWVDVWRIKKKATRSNVVAPLKTAAAAFAHNARPLGVNGPWNFVKELEHQHFQSFLDAICCDKERGKLFKRFAAEWKAFHVISPAWNSHMLPKLPDIAQGYEHLWSGPVFGHREAIPVQRTFVNFPPPQHQPQDGLLTW